MTLRKVYRMSSPQNTHYNTWYRYHIDARLKKNLDEAIIDVKKFRNPHIYIVSGHLNKGKTATAIQIARYIQKDFDPEKQVGKGIDQFLQAWKYTTTELQTPSVVKVCIFDEPAEYTSFGGVRKKISAINEIIDTMKHTQTILFFVGVSFWKWHKHLFEVGALRGYLQLNNVVPKAYVEYALFDAGDVLRILGECLQALKAYNYNQAMYVGYRKYLKQGQPMHGRIRYPGDDYMAYLDRISDAGKVAMQAGAIERGLKEE